MHYLPAQYLREKGQFGGANFMFCGVGRLVPEGVGMSECKVCRHVVVVPRGRAKSELDQTDRTSSRTSTEHAWIE
ncbi:hypothetical protein BLNAU_8572 [Blattamonas nauphoetae]|uniref:Uncharacterized protein n=1 Tax=Blattamonas nauphoetae TaxID=2049346 RepID=A0ABQ9XYI0_9EUKA|nr:hypothetical protein BLNAU_8572 [Blattamonas nauphoetae]